MYEEIEKILNEKKQWWSGETVDVKVGKTRGYPSRLVLRNAGGIITLYLYINFGKLSTRFYSDHLPVALLRSGWESTLNKKDFEQWKKKTSQKLDWHIKKNKYRL